MNRSPRVLLNRRCAYCNEPFRITEHGVEADQVGELLVCNEFCAQAIREEALLQQRTQ